MSEPKTHPHGNLRTLLVVAFHYPPDNSSTGVLRTFKFTEYLLDHGWRSDVISVPETLYPSRNPPGAVAIPRQISVERVWACDVKTTFAFRGIYPSWIGVPDRYWPWMFSATRAGLKTIAKGGVSAIYSTYPVPTAHLIGLRLKKRSGLPWIADFRDPWVEETMPPVRHWLESKMERSVIENADRIICNTPAMRRSFLKRYPDIPESRFVTITNGYDEADLKDINPVPLEKFQILYPGGIDDENRNPRGLFAGIRLALDSGWLNSEDLVVTLLGCGPYADSARFIADLKRYRLESFVQITKDRIPYQKALARMAGADVLVVLSENLGGTDQSGNIQAWTAMQVPAKVYEYLRLGRPMLALVSSGAVEELLTKTGAGFPIPPDDTRRVAEALKDLYQRRNNPLPKENREVRSEISQYSRRNLTVQLAKELNNLVVHRSNENR